MQCSIAPGSFKDGEIGAPGRPALRAVSGIDDFPGITAGAWQMRPLSRGYVEPRSPDPAEAPAINPGYLSDPTDRRAIIGGLHFIRRLFAALALARYCGVEIPPGGGGRERQRATRLCTAKGLDRPSSLCFSSSGRRPGSISPMGTQAAKPIEGHCTSCARTGSKASGSSTLGDATVTSINTNAPTIMIAERGADLIRRATRAAEPGAVARAV